MNTQPRLSVLFVDDEPRILDGLRRQLRPLRAEWNMRFAESGGEALRLLQAEPADVVVADMRMPTMTGASLLRAVQVAWPQTLRIILSGQTDQAELINDIGAIHQFLQKPCEPSVLQAAIRRAYGVRALVESQELRRISAGVNSLPIVTATLKSLMEAVGESASASEVASIVEQDVALTAKILQLVNTSFFGLSRRVVSIKEAVALLGTKLIRTLAVTTRAFDALSEDEKCRPEITKLWLASAAIGARAEACARASGTTPEVVDQAMLAGTLSLIGRALLIRYEREAFRRALTLAEAGTPLYMAEQQRSGAPQQHIGGYALGLWAFPDVVVEAVTFQANPSQSQVQNKHHPLAYVHAARCVYRDGPLVERFEPDDVFLEKVGVVVESDALIGRAA